MGSFGESLRKEREMRGVSLEEISAATKISVRFLQCVENEEFSKLPGGIFVRSFIRSYARYLGLDEEALLAEYQLLAKDKTNSDLSKLTASRPVSSSSPRSSWRAVVLVISIIILLTAGFFLWRHSRQILSLKVAPPAAQKPSAPKAALVTAPATAKSQSPPPAASAQGSPTAPSAANGSPAAAPASPASSSSTPPPSANGELTLQIAATERSWVAIDADGKTVLQGVLQPGQVKTVEAKKAFDVVTGNAQGVVLTLNGQTLKPLGREGEVKSIHLTRGDLKAAGE